MSPGNERTSLLRCGTCGVGSALISPQPQLANLADELAILPAPGGDFIEVTLALSLGSKGVPHGNISKRGEFPTATDIWEHAYQLVIAHLDMIVWNVWSTEHVMCPHPTPELLRLEHMVAPIPPD